MTFKAAFAKLCQLVCLCACLLVASHASAGEGEEKKKTGGSSYTGMQALAINVAGKGPKLGVMTVEIGVDTPDPKLHDKVERWVPRLRAAYIDVMVKFAHSYKAGTAPNADQISQMLQDTTDQILGAKGAKLLLGTIIVNG